MIPTPSINEAYGLVLQEETQRVKAIAVQSLEISAHAITYQNGQGTGNNYS